MTRPATFHPHVLGIDDAPFDKRQRHPVPVVGVLMEGCDLVEGVALAHFPVDGGEATGFLAGWIRTLRFHEALHAVVLGGITMAGLGLVDIGALAAEIGVPVLAVTRKETGRSRLGDALHAAGLPDRLPIVHRTPQAFRASPGLYVACAGIDQDEAVRIIRATLRKSRMPEPLRVAHLVAQAVSRGQSVGRP